MKILLAASECTPYVKTGGLADVVGTLPLALAKAGIDVRVIIPKYRDIPEHWKERMSSLLYFYVNLGWRRQYCGIDYIEHEGVICYFIDNEFYFGLDNVYGSGQQEGERFGFFCRAVLEALPHIGFQPDVIHCNDWQTGMLPALLKTQYVANDFYRDSKVLFTIHNLRYQGIFAWPLVEDLLGISDRYFSPEYLEYYGCASFMKGGLVFADHISTVSPTYAQEIQTPYYGERLDGLIRKRAGELSGILNGINGAEYDPRDDMWLPAHFSIDDMEGKAACKADLQRELSLEQRPEVPIIAVVSRLVDQKGIDLIECVLDDIMQRDVQLVILGSGDEHYQELFSWEAWRYTNRLAACIELNTPLSHRIFAAADMLLMPSQFEPCGLSQMICMRYGTIPIVRETGGLKDSVTPYNKYTGEGNGFSFANYNAHEMLYTIDRTLETFKNKGAWATLMHSAMATDFSWDVSASHYIDLYRKLIGPDATPQKSALIPPVDPFIEVVPAEIEADSYSAEAEVTVAVAPAPAKKPRASRAKSAPTAEPKAKASKPPARKASGKTADKEAKTSGNAKKTAATSESAPKRRKAKDA